jgi:hypothetical protein
MPDGVLGAVEMNDSYIKIRDDLYARIRVEVDLARDAADAWYNEIDRTGVITDRSEHWLEQQVHYNEYKRLIREVELLEEQMT